MNKLNRCLTSACLILAGYASTGAVLADASSMPAFVKEAVGKAKECKRAAHDSRKVVQQDTQQADECTAACYQAYSLYKRQQDQKSQLAQMEYCTRAYNVFKSPDAYPSLPAIPMPSTREEMLSQMSVMSEEIQKLRKMNDVGCASSMNVIIRRNFNLEQAKMRWDGCVERYRKTLRIYGGQPSAKQGT